MLQKSLFCAVNARPLTIGEDVVVLNHVDVWFGRVLLNRLTQHSRFIKDNIGVTSQPEKLSFALKGTQLFGVFCGQNVDALGSSAAALFLNCRHE